MTSINVNETKKGNAVFEFFGGVKNTAITAAALSISIVVIPVTGSVFTSNQVNSITAQKTDLLTKQNEIKKELYTTDRQISKQVLPSSIDREILRSNLSVAAVYNSISFAQLNMNAVTTNFRAHCHKKSSHRTWDLIPGNQNLEINRVVNKVHSTTDACNQI